MITFEIFGCLPLLHDSCWNSYRRVAFKVVLHAFLRQLFPLKRLHLWSRKPLKHHQDHTKTTLGRALLLAHENSLWQAFSNLKKLWPDHRPIFPYLPLFGIPESLNIPDRGAIQNSMVVSFLVGHETYNLLVMNSIASVFWQALILLRKTMTSIVNVLNSLQEGCMSCA